MRSKTWTKVWRARRVTGASTPLSADFERIVLRMAQEEWKRTVRVTRSRDAGGFVSSGAFDAAAMMMRLPRDDD